MKEKKWILIEDELPKHDSTIIIKTHEGLELSPCVFRDRKKHMLMCSEELEMDIVESDVKLEKYVLERGLYSIDYYYRGNSSYEIGLASIEKWTYIPSNGCDCGQPSCDICHG